MKAGSALPAAPRPRLSAFGAQLAAQLEPSRAALASALQADEDARQGAFDATKQLQAAVRAASQAIKDGQLPHVRAALGEVHRMIDALGEVPAQPARPQGIASLFEEVVAVESYVHFFDTGLLRRKSDLRPCFDDEEYLGGCIGFAQELGEYAVQRCLHGDAPSVVLARDVVDALNGELLQFDFRNGPIRRKYDSLKYAKKRLEDLLFEQSLLPDSGAAAEAEPAAKRSRCAEEALEASEAAEAAGSSAAISDCPLLLVDVAEMAAMRSRFEASDAAREAVIKGCRDGQKLAKQAIYSVHRGEFGKAATQAAEALRQAAALTPVVEQHPTLRPGSYTALLEEYAEAALFLAFAQKHTVATLDEVLPPPFASAHDHAAYLGGLVDLTGEIGRLAVAKGTARLACDVDRCVEATAVVSSLLAGLPPSNALKKKGAAVATNLRKMAQVQYELSLAKRGRTSRAAVVDTAAVPEERAENAEA